MTVHVSRFKGYRFAEVGLGFELPKPLAVCDIAVRILHTRYDHLSHHSEREQVQRRRSMMESILTSPSETAAAVQDGKVEGEGDEGESSKQVKEESRSVRSESRKMVSEALIMCTLCTCFLVDSVADNISVCPCVRVL